MQNSSYSIIESIALREGINLNTAFDASVFNIYILGIQEINRLMEPPDFDTENFPEDNVYLVKDALVRIYRDFTKHSNSNIDRDIHGDIIKVMPNVKKALSCIHKAVSILKQTNANSLDSFIVLPTDYFDVLLDCYSCIVAINVQLEGSGDTEN